jgi:iron complex outermembrane recepter protein
MNYLSAACHGSARLSRPLQVGTSLLAMLALLNTPLLAAAESTGTVAGSITSATTRNALQGATVTVPALNRAEFTDSSGAFLLPNLPAGVAELVISYTGFADERRTVTVRPGEATRLDTAMKPSEAVLTMEAFTVATEREGAGLSITEQRNAANIKNVTALDEWGNLPTLSVAELAMRLPGISWTTDEDDVISNVSIRGQPSGFTRLNIDGMSSTGVGGDGRSATLHSFSGAMYEQIEIIAGQTPDKRADGLGGQLNLKTKSALNMSEKRRFNYNVSARWAPPGSNRSEQRADHPFHPVFGVAYQERFDVLGGRRNLGVIVNASYTESVNMIVQDNLFYQSTTDEIAFFNDYTTTSGLNHRFISGISARVDYRLSPRTMFSARFLYNGGNEPYYDRTRIDPIGNGTIFNGTNTGSIVPGFTQNRTELRPVAGAAGTRMELEMWRYSFVSKNPTGTVTGEHNFGALKFDYAARWSNTHWDSGAGRDRQGGQLFMRAENLGFVLDKTDLDGRVFTQTSGADVFDPSSYRTNLQFTKRDTVTDTNEVTGTVNASYNLPTERPMSVKAGLDTVNRRVNNRQVAPRRWNRNNNPAGPAGTQIPLTGYSLMSLTRFDEKNAPPGQRIPAFDPASVHHSLNDTSLWTEDLVYAAQQPFTSRRIFEEAVDAGYIQGQARFGRFTVLGGVRVEDVKIDTFTYVKYRATTVAAEPDPFKRALLDYGTSAREGGYTKSFPSIHFSYDITSNLKARASWSTSYGRPTLAQIVAGTTWNDQQETVTSGNPAVGPQLAKNIDLKLEYYFKNSGVFTVSVFEKKITDYILNATIGVIESGPNNGYEGNFAGYSLIGPENAGDADVRGFEFDYRQRLTFLPGLLKGLTFAANYTWLKTEGRFTGNTPITANDVPGFIPRTGNVRLVYNYKRFGASALVNFTGEHIHALSAIAPLANRLYRKDLYRVNFGVSYKWRPDVQFYADVSNIFEEGITTYRYIPSRIRQEIWAGRTINIGVSGQF